MHEGELMRELNMRLFPILFVIGLAWGAIAYGGSTPSTLGHSTGEIKYLFSTYSNDCKANDYDSTCVASCVQPNERAVGGNCISDFGFSFKGYGVTDASSGMQSWECFDSSHGPGVRLLAEVVCLRVGG